MDKKHIEEIDVDDILKCCRRRLADGPPAPERVLNESVMKGRGWQQAYNEWCNTWETHLKSFIAYIEQYIAYRDRYKKSKIN